MAKEETKKCKKCMEEINKKAKRCPKCGANLGIPGFVKVLIVLAVIFGLCVSCMSSCTDAVNDSIEETEKEFKDEYSDKNGKKTFKIGETFENKHLKVTITDVNTDWKDYSEYFEPSEGKKIIQIAITAENVGKDSEDISSLYFNCYADDVLVDEYIWSEDSYDFGGTISKGKKTTGYIYYEVPVNSKKYVLEYEPNVLDDEIQVTFNLN